MITVEKMKEILADAKLMNDFLTKKHDKIKVRGHVDYVFFLDNKYKLLVMASEYQHPRDHLYCQT